MDALLMSKIEYIRIDIEDFLSSDYSFKDFLGLTYRINMESSDILSFFYENEHKNYHFGILDYNVSPEYVDVLDNYRYRYFIIKAKNRYILFTVKIVEPRVKDGRYFTITSGPFVDKYPPLESDMMVVLDDTSRIMDRMMSLGFFKNAEVVCSENTYTRNLYFNQELDFQTHMNKSKWRSSKGINKMNSIIDVSVVPCTDIINREYDEILEIWGVCTGKIQKDSKDWRYYHKQDHNSLRMSERSNVGFIMTFRFHDKLVGITCGFKHIIDKWVIIPMQRSLGVATSEFLSGYLDIDKELADYIRNHLGAFVQYHINRYCFEVLGLDALFYGGDMSDKKMKEFKELYYKNEVRYSKIPLEDYVKEYQ